VTELRRTYGHTVRVPRGIGQEAGPTLSGKALGLLGPEGPTKGQRLAGQEVPGRPEPDLAARCGQLAHVPGRDRDVLTERAAGQRGPAFRMAVVVVFANPR